MSTINNALSKLAEQHSEQSPENSAQSTLVRATVSPIKSSRFVWAIGGFTLSLGIGAWAVTSAPTPIHTSVNTQPTSQVTPTEQNKTRQPQAVSVPSNTSKVVPAASTAIYTAPQLTQPKATQPKTAELNSAKSKSVAPKHVGQQSPTTPNVVANNKAANNQVQNVASRSQSVKAQPQAQPKAMNSTDIKLAATHSPATTVTHTQGESANDNVSSMQVQQIELTHRQMADKAIDRANKAIEANDFETASNELQIALRYVAQDENVRRKLAALYYGNRQVRKSAELLEEGIKLNKNSNALRMSLAGILVKEKQPEAALNALGYLPDNVNTKYLAMRAALAQQLKNNQVAKQSYQMLTQRDPDNGRWWLGLGIQQERNAELAAAKESYTKALTMVGLSSQSQAFIRDRLALLATLEGGDN